MKVESKYAQPSWLADLQSADLMVKNRAYQAMMDEWQRRVYSHIYQLVGNHADADDTTQETFIQLLKSIHTFEERSQFSTWLFTIAHRKGIETLRKRSRIKKHVVNDDEALTRNMTSPQAQHLSAEQINHHLERAIQGLPTRQKQVFLLHYYEGQSFRSIGEITGITTGALKASYHHARKKIETALANDKDLNLF
ncbi:MAG: RNA polymerase sigma factor [Crocinitomicaceae bacterium]|jgi:RNA polymerase sigma factor (sigma-70 family)|nr:RNA polymerase sigma factor [Crocinitomicaceae bacterium]MDB4493588.1 RNA polymerase sigma factor [Flavobacteriales bacterium]